MNDNFLRIKESIASHPGRKWFVLSTVLLGATMSALDISIVNVAMPTLKTTFGVSMAVIEWLTMAYMLTLTIFLPLFGRLADIYGRSKLYNLGFGVFSLGSLFCGLATSATMMIGARVIQAIGAGLLQANSVALISSAFPTKERGKAIGVQGATQAVSMAIGPFVGGILITTAGWQTIFFINIPIGILGIIAGLFILPTNERTSKDEKIDYLGTALFAGGLGGIVLSFNEGVNLGWTSPLILLYFSVGTILLSLFVHNELKTEHPLIDLKLFKNSTFFLGNLSGLLSYFVLFAVLFLMPFYLERVLDYSASLTGFMLTPLLLAMAVAAPVSGMISDKFGPRLMTTSGMLLAALACLALMFVGATVQLSVLVTILIILGLGMGLFTTSNNSAIMGAAPYEKLGMAGGLLNMTRSLGLILGVDISGGIFTMLEHRYLAATGYNNLPHVFTSTAIPITIKDNAFMHGFLMVLMVLLSMSLLATFLSAAKSGPAAGIIDHELAGNAVVSSGFLSGFNQDFRSMAFFIMLLIFTGIVGSVASTQLGGKNPLSSPRWFQGDTSQQQVCLTDESQSKAAKQLALTYYTQKYHDQEVNIKVGQQPEHIEADVYKNGLLVKKLFINDQKVTEQRTGLNEWMFFMLSNV